MHEERPGHRGGDQPRSGRTCNSLRRSSSITYESQAQAYALFKQEFSQDQSFVSTVSKGDIPNSFQVKLKNTQADFPIVAETVEGRPGVDQIVDDSSILDKFYKLLDGARNAVVIIAIILLIAAILLVANTIRLSAFNRRRETSIMRLVGASNFYVQLPFLVEGVIAGLFGWLVAAGLLIAVKTLVAGYAAAVLPIQRAAERNGPDRGHRPGDDHRRAALRCHVVPDAQALPAGMTSRGQENRGSGAGDEDHRQEPASQA